MTVCFQPNCPQGQANPAKAESHRLFYFESMKEVHGRESGIRKQGFTLVECVLAIGVVGVALLSIMGLLPVASATLKESTSQTVVAHINQSLSSQYRKIPFPEIRGGTHYFDNDGLEVVEAAGARFRAEVDVEQVAAEDLALDGGAVKRLVIEIREAAVDGGPLVGKRGLVISDSGRR